MVKFLNAFFCVFLAAGMQGSQGSTHHDDPLINAPHQAHNPGLVHSAAQHEVLSRMKRNSNVHGMGGSSMDDMLRITGGTKANKHEFPWLVSQLYEEDGKIDHYCGGSVIDQSWVLTAAHCCTGLPNKASLRSIVAGEHNLRKNDGTEQRRRVTKIIVHPRFDQDTLQNDICLLKLAQPLHLDGKTVTSINLPSPSATPVGDCVVAGWGHGHGSKNSDILKKVQATIITDEECRQIYYGYFIPIVDSMICAGYLKGTEGFCKGDSGGSLICLGPDKRYFQAGVVSWVFQGCTTVKYPGVYTEMSHYVNWVNYVIHTQ